MVDAATLPAAAVAPRSRWVLWVAVAVPLLAACAPRDLWAPDEPRYGLVAQGMLDTGDLLVPRINGQPYAEKPPLAFAAMAATGLVTGEVTAVGARLACAAFAALAVFLVARLARRWFRDAATAETAALLFSTTGLVLWNGSRAALDLPMTACGLLALDAGTTLLERRSWPAALGFGAALGAGLLVKGPHVFYVPLAALVGGALASGRGRRLLDPRWLVGLALALGLAAAWLVPAVARAGDALAYNDDVSFGRRVLGQLSDRVAGDDVPHEHGPLYLFPLLLAFGLPWTPAWLLALPAALRPRRAPEGDRLGLGAAAWGLLVPLLALSLPRSKRELYLVPLLAATAWLGAYGLHRGIGPRGRAHLARGLGVAGLVAAVLAVAVPLLVAADALPLGADERAAARAVRGGPATSALGAVALLAAVGGVVALRLRDRAVASARAVGVAVAAAWVVVATAVMPAFDPWKSFASAARAGERAAPQAPLAIWGFSDASVLWSFPHRGLSPLGTVAYREAARVLAPTAPPVLVLAKEKTWRERDRRASPEDRAVLDRARILWAQPVGGIRYLLLTNAAP